MSIFEHKFWDLLHEFTDFQQKKNDPAKSPWHRKDSRGGTAMNQHQVADRYKGRYTGEHEFKYSGELNNKIELVRSGNSAMQVLSDLDMKYILNNYSTMEITKDKPKKIFDGVIVYWDPIKDSYILAKDE